MSPPVSVVVTCCDLGRWLPEAVASVRAQTAPPSEVVVVDASSEDPVTRAVLHRLHDGVRIVSSGRTGPATARNAGLAAARHPWVVLLDADDLLDPGALHSLWTAAEADPGLSFATSWVSGFGERQYTAAPRACGLRALLAAPGLVHTSTLFRRSLWSDLGGFDETLPALSLEEFWLRAVGAGARGTVVPEALLRKRIREFGRHRRELAAPAHIEAWRAMLARHGHLYRDALPEAWADTVQESRDVAAADAAVSARVRQEEAVLAGLREEVARLSEALQQAGRAPVEWGDLARTRPVSDVWGYDRGAPQDRPYIEAFLDAHRAQVRGAVLEVGGDDYIRRFGDGVTRADVVDVDPGNSQATITADLRRAPELADEAYDCIILTQTLHLIDDMEAVLRECRRALKTGGVLLATLPCLSRIDPGQGEDGDSWRLTSAAARRLFAACFGPEAVEVESHGNVLVATAFLYGLAAHELTAEERAANDPFFPLVLTVRACKMAGLESAVHA